MDSMDSTVSDFICSENLLKLFSAQNSTLLAKVFENLDFQNHHIELSWFADAIRRAADGFPARGYAPELVRDEIFRQLTEHLSVWTMGFDINYVITLSGEVQEQAEVKDYFLVILPFEDLSAFDGDMLLKFSEEDQVQFDFYTIHAIRKQLNLSKNGALAVCKDIKTNLFHTVGILSKAAAERYPRFFFSRRLQWEFFLPKTELNCKGCDLDSQNCEYTTLQVPCRLSRLRYDRGTFMMPFTDLFQETEEYLVEQLKHLGQPDACDIATKIASIIKETEKCKKGAVIIFSDKKTIIAEAEHLTGKHRGLCLPDPIPLSGSDENESISRMASIDGAILADYSGICYAYGVILDGIAIESGKSERGARYNCTKSYIDSHRRGCFGKDSKRDYPSIFVGVVLSEDGQLNIIL